MSRYIDADVLIAKCKAIINDKWNEQAAPASWSNVYADFIDDIENMPTADVGSVKHWISVKDRLPENDGLYIVCKTIGEHQICFGALWAGNKWISVANNNKLDYVTHWMPFPEPPEPRKEVKDNE